MTYSIIGILALIILLISNRDILWKGKNLSQTQRSMQAGLNAHLSKPVEPDALFETLENLIK